MPATQDSAEKPARVNCLIVEAGEQDIHEAPSTSSLLLVKLLESAVTSTDACVPAGLSMIKKDRAHGLYVLLPKRSSSTAVTE